MLVNVFQVYHHFRSERGVTYDGHWHRTPNSGEMNIVLSGCLEIACGENVFRLRAGEMALWNAEIFHRNRVIEDGTEYLVLEFSTDTPIGKPTVCRLSAADQALLTAIDDEANDGGEGRITLAGRNMVEALLLRMPKGESVPKDLPQGMSAVYQRAVQFMMEHIGEQPNIAEIARHCSVCQTTLKKAFATYAGKGVKTYFMELKLEKARRMIENGSLIEEAAFALGFSSPSYFSQCFRRHHAMSASEWRKRDGEFRYRERGE